MDFWRENQGQSPLYSRFGTVPGRNWANNYNDRHQATYHPLYYSVQQDQGRESSHWTAQGPRTGGGPHDYTNWTDQDLTSLTSSQFPFVLDHHPQQHQDLGEYQLHEARSREWAAAQQAAREYDRGCPREGWQRRWELCSPVRYNREVSTKRSDNSYRELEAWAARYSHSLPRRKRIEAELRGASKGFLESRDSSRSADPRVAALQQVMQSAHIKESGLWDRGGGQQGLVNYPSQTPPRETSHMLDMKEKISYQRRMFSQPPGYIAPPPYNGPHKSSPGLYQCDTSLEKDGNRQSYWSQQDVSVDLLGRRKVAKEDFQQPDGNLKTYPELEGLKHRRQQTVSLWASSPEMITNIQPEGMLSPQQPQVLQAVQDKRINEDSLLKVIEGRKFRLNKKTGGMTIFCLVSRIAGTSETTSLPLCTSRNIQNTDSEGVTKDLKDSDDKLSDEVDFRVPPLTEQSNTSDSRSLQAKQEETPNCVENKMLEDNLSKKSETSIDATNYTESSFGRQVSQSVQPASVKYPLWREPSFTSRAESESPSSCPKEVRKDAKCDVSQNQEDSVIIQPIDIEVRRLDITKATESEDSNGLLVIDTTCVLVKMELIPSPKKEHVHYLHTSPNIEDSPPDIPSSVSPEVVQSNSQELTADPHTQTNPWQLSEDLQIQLDTDHQEKLEPAVETEISFPYSSSPVSERETLAERAERILGIPLQDYILDQELEATCLNSFLEIQVADPSLTEDNNICEADQQINDDTQEKEESQNQTEISQTEDQEPEATCLNSFLEIQVADPSATEDNNSCEADQQINDDTCEADQQINDDTQEKEESQNQTEISQTEDVVCLQENDDAKDQKDHKSDEDFAKSQEQVCDTSEENDVVSPLVTDIKCSFESERTEDMTEQNHDENQPVENDALPQKSVLTDQENQTLSPEVSSLTDTPFQELPPPSLPTPSSQSSDPHTDQSPSSHSVHSVDQTAGALSSVVENQDEIVATLQLIHDEMCDNHGKDTTEEWESKEQFESGQPDDASSVKEFDATDDQRTKPAVKDPFEDIMDDGVQSEDVACTTERYLTEEELPKEVSEDLTDHSTEDILKEYDMQVNALQQQTECFQADKVQDKDSYMSEEQHTKEVTEDLTGVSTDYKTDSQVQLETNIVQDIEPMSEGPNSSPSSPHWDVSPSHLDVLSPPELPSLPDASNKPDKELVPLLETDSVCPFVLSSNVDVSPAEDIRETSFHPLPLDSYEEYPPLQSSPDLPLVLPACSSPPLPHEGSESCSPDFTLTEQPQYPRSLRDAVNRIRKHTAPDSENEEEEVSEPWDPESLGEDRAEIMKAVNTVFDEVGQQVYAKGSVDEVGEGQIKQSPETCGHVEEDTLSCSSTSSHSSGDTVIIADEEEVEELQYDAGTEINKQNYEKFQEAEEE